MNRPRLDHPVNRAHTHARRERSLFRRDERDAVGAAPRGLRISSSLLSTTNSMLFVLFFMRASGEGRAAE
jgi:hypothetical protein